MTTSTDSLTSVDACLQTGATYRQLDYWARIGLIFPLGVGNPGSGYRRRWDPSSIPGIKRMVALSSLFDQKNRDLLRPVLRRIALGDDEITAEVNGIRISIILDPVAEELAS